MADLYLVGETMFLRNSLHFFELTLGLQPGGVDIGEEMFDFIVVDEWALRFFLFFDLPADQAGLLLHFPSILFGLLLAQLDSPKQLRVLLPPPLHLLRLLLLVPLPLGKDCVLLLDGLHCVGRLAGISEELRPFGDVGLLHERFIFWSFSLDEEVLDADSSLAWVVLGYVHSDLADLSLGGSAGAKLDQGGSGQFEHLGGFFDDVLLLAHQLEGTDLGVD
jgi:hypothetical protein